MVEGVTRYFREWGTLTERHTWIRCTAEKKDPYRTPVGASFVKVQWSGGFVGATFSIAHFKLWKPRVCLHGLVFSSYLLLSDI